MDVLGAIVIGFLTGIIAKLVTPGQPKPQGFILTTVLGIVGALLATYLGQAIGLYRPGETAGFLGAIVGAVIVLIAWRQLARPR
ncbi:GlsB/YeaQ/YmgE family stress response membrane protein [Devosia sp.]|uniref:GlsB/YeaQ/YmgE family stress response membrane protein n=1 Tax=Devosia sp. TaxID=1871048 RepID=UPI002F01AE70